MSSINLLAPIASPFPGFVNGKPFKTKNTFAVADPHNPQVILREVYGSDVEEAAQAIQAAQDALPAWKNTPIEARRRIFLKAVDVLNNRTAEFQKIQVDESTIGPTFTAINNQLTVHCLEELAAAATSALAGTITQTNFPGQTAHVTREPYGVVLGITPWNAPLVLATRAVATPIIAGNTAVLKTSELTPVSNAIIAEIFREAGLPDGVLNVVHVSAKDAPKVVESMIANPLVRKVNFTGSTRLGSIIGSLCGKHIKSSVLELGGAAVLIVLEDADLELAAKNAIYGGFLHSGQICMSTNNLLVHESVADEFVALLQKELKNVKAGTSSDPEANLLRGVYTQGHASRQIEIISDAVKKGAKVVAGDDTSKPHDGGNVVQPTIIDGVKPGMEIYSEEVFGPIMGIIRFKTDDEAIAITNALEYGLAGAVHGRDVGRAGRVARQMDVSLVHINTFTMHDNATVPHGGWKKSGYGRFNGFEGIREFTQTKCVTYLDLSAAPPVPTL